ncbi:Eco57I restriction-modification methylase domain-containing protein [Haloferax sp. Atlit-48N]|uniref:TaqI-like C-terminal specificity domain-containing protein n=1 Tax=Haloferax sp. Atlit-48N TaxID=2077198 RepID=A0ACD5HZP7_9EURY|nr:Eco57I restriction-modification methylase domain-containing protein [Haloferax sp. Atlit-48N]RDZ29841.1 restriction endonuclease [Haloferax sp. Atlit-48N]
MSQQSHPYRTNRDLFSNHYLTEHLRQTEPWKEVDEAEVREAYDEINELWEDKQDRVEDYNEAQLERNFIRPVFDILGIPFEIEETVKRNARRPDYGFFPSTEAADAAFDRDDFYEEAIAVADAKYWGRELDTRGEKKRDYENPSYQIHDYLMETPPQWGVLTNGKEWRIYYGPTSHRLDSYYEIDLPELFEFVEGEGSIEDFKDFYLFFRQQAFLPDRSGDCFLDDVYDESSVFAEAIGEDLQNNIYEAIRVLAEGFLDTNDDLDEDDLPLIHDSSLIYLYRLIFVLYAESEGRDLLPTDNDIYGESYSLNELKQTVADNRDETQQHYQTWQTNLWNRLEELFVLIDQGSQGKNIPKDQLYIPAYNGGLFRTNPDPDDSAEAQFLASHEADDAHLAEVIDLLTRRDADEGDGQVFVDYSSLDERHLGSIYEGLLEYKLDVADEPLTVDDGEYSPAGDGDDIEVEEGDVYLRTDAGERKATGSYYTPEYVVEYIVDETLGPLVDGIREDLVGTESYKEGGFAGEFADQVFDLKVLDPAMGSGHFLVNAVDYLAREIIDAQERQDQQAVKRGDDDAISDPRTEEGELRDINWARRKVAQQCIYGVDLNPLATELAKVSLWLRTLAAEQPLAFLDHHLKTGNSLVGSDIEDVLSNSDDGGQSGQTQLTDWMDQARQRALEHVMERFTDLLSIDNETLEDIKEMEQVYETTREDALYQHLLAMANVHTASEFGLSVPVDAEEQMAEALRDDSWEDVETEDWFRNAQALAKKESFFHWELEFPVAFYGKNGARLGDAGFDAVIGNPPYVKIQTIAQSLKDYLSTKSQVARKKYDLYMPFVEQSIRLAHEGGYYSQIIPSKFTETDSGRDLRRFLLEESREIEYVDFIDHQVFSDATTYTCIIVVEKGNQSGNVQYRGVHNRQGITEGSSTQIGYDKLTDGVWSLSKYSDPVYEIQNNVLKRLEGSYSELDQVFKHISKGIDPGGSTDIFVVDKKVAEENNFESELLRDVIPGDSISRWNIETESQIIFPYKRTGDRYDVLPEDKIKNTNVYSYLSEYRQDLSDRDYVLDAGKNWYELWNERQPSSQESEKLVICNMSKTNRFALDDQAKHTLHTTYSLVPDEHIVENLTYLLGVMNSTLLTEFFKLESTTVRGGYYRYNKMYLEHLPIRRIDASKKSSVPNFELERVLEDSGMVDILSNVIQASGISPWSDSNSHDLISVATESIIEYTNRRSSLNLSLMDYLGNYEEGPNLPDVGLFQPTSSNILDATTDEYEKLQVENIRTLRNGHSVTIKATARYKPEDKDEFETDTWGYTETDHFEAFTLADLTDEEAALIEAFVPVAVEDEIGGFSDNATKTISLIDRLKDIKLPNIDDVQDDLQRYIGTKERADELDEKIEKTDQLIDEIVYDLYDLTEEEIEIVEKAANSDQE